ncbi:MarR family winged helix-turn-helix transcriptional regulator [Kineococcus sp. SYSU DK004]|uniref:MarR family winged helix-turn-helix transcriptional regulator n=1 Tax=Kineococcus sp. SYSU DK004 TaxID=3383125 RepID=UPI003D7E0679
MNAQPPGEQAPASPDAGVDAAVDAAIAASRALVAIATRSLSGALEALSLQQYRILVLVCTRGPQRSGALADAVGVHPSTFSRAVDRLVAGGWVRRRENPETRREVLVEPTPEAARLVEEVMAARRREVRDVLARLSGPERAAVAEGLRLFATAAGEPDPRELARLGHEA